MKYLLIILSCYIFYFVVNIIYDLFFAKQIDKNKNNDENPNFALEEQDISFYEAENNLIEEGIVRNVTVENVEGISTDDFVDDEEIENLDLDDFNITAKAKMEQEAFTNFEDTDDSDGKFNDISVSDFSENQEEDLIYHTFLNKFQKSLSSKKIEETNLGIINNEDEIIEMLDNPDNVISFEYSSMKMVS